MNSTRMIQRCLLAALFLLPLAAIFGQSITTGDVSGTVKDTTEAVVVGATVTLTNQDTGESRTATTNETGAYRFTFLKPGNYRLEAATGGLKSDTAKVAVQVGQVATVNLTAKIQATSSVIEVTDAAAVVQTDNANLASTYSGKQIELLPIPGGDITTVAYTVPGIVVSTGAGYGNFSSHGLPGSSNLFTLNGNDNMDPYLNLNNSGASNLTLGANEVAEAAVVQNGYSVQYGRQAGAQLNFITKSGTNAFHGNLLYNWNGDRLNANDFFANATGTPRGKAVSNQYAASFGGRIIKDKTFFYVDTEGLRYALPAAGTVSVPSQALQNYVLSHVGATQTALYKQVFDLYAKAPGVSRAIPVSNGNGVLQDGNGTLGCGALAGTPTGTGGKFGVDTSCANAFNTNNSSVNTEWLFSARVDHSINAKQKLSFRYKTDHGLQATGTDPINPLFNQFSSQPSYEGQVNHTYVISAAVVNNFIGSGSWYTAIFGPLDFKAALAAFPSYFVFTDGGSNGSSGLTSLGPNVSRYPQGRNVGQAQITDDLSIMRGRHTWKVGVNFRRNRVSDRALQQGTLAGAFNIAGLDEFAKGAIDPSTGNGSTYTQTFAQIGTAHIRLYSLGFYAQDEWSLTPNIRITAGLRFDRNADPSCVDHCFSRLDQPFSSSAFQKGAGLPYNQSIQSGLDHAFKNVEAIVPQPRFGIVWSPSRAKGTVLRGGIGLFSDLPPGSLSSYIFTNLPNSFAATVTSGLVNTAGAGSAAATALGSYNAFRNGFANGATLAQLQQAVSPVPFAPPNFYSTPDTLLNPKYLEWSFEVQQQIGARDVLSLSYVGNHGMDALLRDSKVNGYAPPSKNPRGFAGLPSTAPDPRFLLMTELTNHGISNYDGLSLTFRRALGYGFQGQVGYTWSHALDDLSGTIGEPFIFLDSLTRLAAPSSQRLNYASSDFDIRHNVTGDFVWDLPYKLSHRAMNSLVGGWTVSSKFFARTGPPFTVTNSKVRGQLANSVDSAVLAFVTDPGIRTNCTSVDQACFSASQFAPSSQQTSFGNFGRNSFRAPGYFDIDTAVYKKIAVTERVVFTLGASAYNLLNHPNFASPAHNAGIAAGLGVISASVGAPSSPYGSFQGSSVNGRVMVLTGKFNF